MENVRQVRNNPFRDSYYTLFDQAEKERIPFVFFDLETTGLDTEKCEIIQLAAIRCYVENGQFVQSKDDEPVNIYIHPVNPIPEEASRINGITNDLVADKKYFRQMKKEMEYIFRGNPVLAGYNSYRFDVPFLKTELKRAGISIPFREEQFDVMYLVKDTMTLGTKKGEDIGDFKLTTVTMFFNPDFDTETAHDAIVDIKNTVLVANECLFRFFCDPPIDGTEKTTIKSWRYWSLDKGIRNEKIYVITSNGQCEYDIVKRCWNDKTDYFRVVNVAWLEEDLREQIICDTGEYVEDMESAGRLLGRLHRAELREKRLAATGT